MSDDDIELPGERGPWPMDEWPWREHTDDQNWALLETNLTCPVFFAQASFHEFARAAEYERFRIVPTYEAVGIKAFFGLPNNPLAGEHIFLTNVFTDGKSITATLNADAWRRPDLKEGQEVIFPIEKLSDWFLVRDGRGLGGFTIPHVWSQLAKNEQQQVRGQPPFVWFEHRGDQTAMDELFAMPTCAKCGKRNFMDLSAWQGSRHAKGTKVECGICQSGSQRCNCPKCGAPLIRNSKLPKLCARCVPPAGKGRG